MCEGGCKVGEGNIWVNRCGNYRKTIVHFGIQKYGESKMENLDLDDIEFMRKVAQGLEDYKNGRVYSVEKTFEVVEKL